MHTKILVYGHLLNPLWLSHDKRRRIRKTVIANAKVGYLKTFEDDVINISPSMPSSSDNYEKSERLFTIWFQGENQAPPIVRACIRSMRKHLDEPVEVLDEKSLFNWITLPDHIMDKWQRGLISRTHFSDICRIELLYQYGGVWADATDFFTNSIPSTIMNEDFFMFMAGDNLKLGGTHAFIQSCFMRIKKGNPLLGMWRKFIFLYWEKEDKLLDYFTIHFLLRYLVENNICASCLFSKMPKLSSDPTHILFWEYKDKPFSYGLYNDLTKHTFFQKTTYKDKSAQNPIKGSMAEYIILYDFNKNTIIN